MISRLLRTTTLATVGLSLAAATVAAAPTSIEAPASASETAVRGDTYALPDEQPPPADPSAFYKITLDIEWGSSSHPQTLPPNSHVSPPVAVIHSAPGVLFAVGTLASPGVESMAETGSTSTLQRELDADDRVLGMDVGRSIFGPGGQEFERYEVQQSGDLFSLVTMLAPSPDWFVGVADVDLFVDGAWVDEMTLPLGNYDAGTDSGADFTSPNADTQPAVPIGGPADAAFATAVAEGRFGTVTITRIVDDLDIMFMQ